VKVPLVAAFDSVYETDADTSSELVVVLRASLCSPPFALHQLLLLFYYFFLRNA
jgi:hypothetical protein